jgi:hypothetical protein
MSQPMERLRTARPAPVALLGDSQEMFAAIVAAPREAVPAHRARSRRTLVVVCAALALAVVTAGSAFAFTNLFGWHTDHSLVTSPRVWHQLYVEAQHDLTMPPGMRWPDRSLPPKTVTSRNEPGGMAVAVSQVSWECYWAHAIRTGDVAAQARAHAALSDLVAHHIVVAPPGSPENVAPPSWVKPPFEILASDGGYAYVKHMYAEAAAGNGALIAQSCRANS